MRSIACKQMGQECEYVAKGNDVREIILNLMQHSVTEHPSEFIGLTDDQQKAFGKKMIDIIYEQDDA